MNQIKSTRTNEEKKSNRKEDRYKCSAKYWLLIILDDQNPTRARIIGDLLLNVLEEAKGRHFLHISPGLDFNSRILFQAAADAAGKGLHLQPHDHLVGDDETCAVWGLFHQRSTSLNFIERFDLSTWAYMVIFLQSIWQPTVNNIQQVETTVH